MTERLPEGLKAGLSTEAQWEYACRAGTTTAFSWGESWDDDKSNGNHGAVLQFEPHEKDADSLVPVLRSPTKTTPVKKYSPNPWRLYDMHGNVREWNSDWYGAYPQSSEENPAVDPKGADCAETKVCRGGAWYGYDWSCRAAYRVGYFPDDHASYLGFRFLLICE